MRQRKPIRKEETDHTTSSFLLRRKGPMNIYMVRIDHDPVNQCPENLPLLLQRSGGEDRREGSQSIDGVIRRESSAGRRFFRKARGQLLLLLMQIINPALDHLQINAADLVQIN